MQDENGIVRKPIGLHEMKRILGTTNADTGVICTSGNINKYARYKPFRNSNPKFANEADYYNARVEANFGLNIKAYTGLTGLNTLLADAKAAGEAEVWTFDAPRGIDRTPKEWFRISDFEGYSTDFFESPREFDVQPRTAYGLDSSGQYILNILHRLPTDIDLYITEDSLTATIGGMPARYFGIVWREVGLSGVSNLNVKTFGNNIYNPVRLSDYVTMASGKSYDAAFFYSPIAIGGQSSVTSEHTFYPLPKPYVNFGLDSSWGIVWQGSWRSATLADLAFSAMSTGSNSERRFKDVKLCYRRSDHVRRIATTPRNFYEFTTTSPDASIDEMDVNVYNAIQKGGSTNTVVIIPNGIGYVDLSVLPPKKPVLPGDWYVKYTHQVLSGSTWSDDKTYIEQITFRSPME